MNAVLRTLIFFFIYQISFGQDSISQITIKSSPKEIKVALDSLEKKVNDSFYQNKFVEVIKDGSRGIELAESIGDEEVLFKFHRVYGSALLRMKDTARAKNIFISNYQKAKKSTDSTSLVGANLDLGNFYKATEKWELATKYYKKSILFCDDSETTQLFILNFNLSEIFLNTEVIFKAEYHINKLRKYVVQLDSPIQESSFYLIQARLFDKKKKYDKAIEYYNLAVSKAKEVNYSDVILEAYNRQIIALENNGETGKINRVRAKLDAYTKDNIAADKEKAIKEVIVNLNLEQYKQELKSTELENQFNKQKAEKNRILNVVMIGALCILSIILVGIYLGYTKRKKLILKLQEKNKLYLTARKETEELAKVKTNFLSAVTHELRTPLYGIIGISSILQEEVELSKHKNDIDSLKFSADYLLAMINDVLYLNKLDALEGKKLVSKPFQLDELISKIITSLEFMKTKNNNKIEVKIENNVPLGLKGDFVKLSQILINLISNACKFTEEGTITVGVSTVSLASDKVKLNFSVKDNGLGISKEKQKDIFNEFTQDSGSAKFQGTGLGLSIVKRLLDLHDAPIDLKSKKNQGTEFKFSILYDIAKEEEFKTETKETIIDKTLDGGHVLVVDDNKINRLVTKKVLERSNFVCSTAENGKIATEMIENEVFDLVLMDLNMPVMDGFEATSHVRKFNKTIPIIALTATDLSQIDGNIYDKGFTDLIIKPYKDDDFIEVVKKNFLETVSI